jgi:hypothetical protein
MTRRIALALPTAVVAVAFAVTPSLAAVPAPSPTVGSAPAVSTQGIIMRDGGVCDPIRHMGC